jgi:hypothetical protein
MARRRSTRRGVNNFLAAVDDYLWACSKIAEGELSRAEAGEWMLGRFGKATVESVRNFTFGGGIGAAEMARMIDGDGRTERGAEA